MSVRWLLAAPWVALLSACGEPPAPKEPVTEEEPVDTRVSKIKHRDFPGRAPDIIARTTFLSSTAEIRPGGSFTIATHFVIEPGYRVGWLNPGDVGKATRVRFVVPEGFGLGPVHFTAPERFTAGSNLVGYGYQNELVAFARVTAPSDLASGDVRRFDVEASWLACAKECTSESTQAYFELSVNPHAAEGEFEPDVKGLIRGAPVQLTDVPDAKWAWDDDGLLTVSAPGLLWKDYYPYVPAAPEVALSEASLGVRVGDEMRVMGIAVADQSGGQTFVQIDLARPSTR